MPAMTTATLTSVRPIQLNPYAPVFVPTIMTFQEPCDQPTSPVTASNLIVNFLSLAPDVLECVFSHLHHPEDLVALGATCKRLTTAASRAPLSLTLASPRCSAFDSRTLGKVLVSVCRSFPSTRALDLSGTGVEDGDVLAACALLHGLQQLQLANCRKITDALFVGGGEGGTRFADVAPNVHVLGLQRCFQMTDDALAAITHTHAEVNENDAANDNTHRSDIVPQRSGFNQSHPHHAPSSRPLSCLVMSHLDLQPWPPHSTLTNLGITTLSNIRVLALLNSTLDANALRTLRHCTSLQYLCLGGSLTCYTPPDAPLGDTCSEGKTAHHAAVWRQVDGSSVTRAALAAAWEFDGCRRGDRQPQPALALAVELAALVMQLKQLQVLETTFALRGVVPALRALLDEDAGLLVGRSAPLLLDLTDDACVEPLLSLHAKSQEPTSCAGLTMALQAAACCSSPTRHTPLHLASHDGNTRLVGALLDCGARWDLRDRGGNTPLFLACELGHDTVVDALLEAGPDAALVKNNAGELPLYIAALRGHQSCVSRLVRNWQLMGVLWQLPAMYSEGWTPLHAAVVGNHGPLVHQLLRLAGPLAGPMVASTNRNGQTVLHVAACTGSVNMLRILLEVAGASVLATADSMGRTALQIAQKSGNRAAAELLSCRTHQYTHRGGAPGGRVYRKQQHA